MRIGLIVATASPSNERQGLARSRGLALVETLARLDPRLTILGYGHPPEPGEFPESITWRAAPSSNDPWQDLADRNPDRLDALLVLDPLALLRAGLAPPARPLERPAMLAILDDPARVQGREGDWLPAGLGDRAHVSWPRLRAYDFLLTAEADHRETWANLLGLSTARVQSIEGLEALGAFASKFLARREIRRTSRSRPMTRPRLAIFSPWPPTPSGIADHAARLARALRDRYSIDLYHEPGSPPPPGPRSSGFGAFEPREFARRDRVVGYRGVIYQMGNSPYHGFVHEVMIRRPGLVTLHDFCLSGFQFWRAHQEPGDPFENLRRLIAEHYPDRFESFEPHLRSWTEEPGGFAEALARRGLAVNREVFESAGAVVLHSRWCAAWAARCDPAWADRIALIPLGASPRSIPPERRRATRERFGLPVDQALIGIFGILAPEKMNRELLDAFREVADEFPGALVVFVGADWEAGATRGVVEELRLSDRVRFLGRQPDSAYQDLIGSVDLGVSLRRPPTHGETSAALLDLLRHGIPTIINEAGTLADYPDSVVRRIFWEREGHDGLVAALREMLGDRSRREALGRVARDYVEDHHAWPRVAARYAAWIERMAEEGPIREASAFRRAV